MRHVELLTENEKLLMEDGAADVLEKLLAFSHKNLALQPDIHRFSLCFITANGNVFTMPGAYWVEQFQRRIGRTLKAFNIIMVEGQHGADSLWDVQIYNPRMEERRRRNKGRE